MKNKNKIRIIAAAIFALWAKILIPTGHSDAYIIDRVVKLSGNDMSCTGEQIKAPSGASYILSAGHCAPLAVNGEIMAEREDGRKLMRKIIAEDPNSDLLLLEGMPNLEGLDVAKYSYRFQNVRTFTHGRGMPTYKTQGTSIGFKTIMVGVFEIDSPEADAKCTGKKYKQMDSMFGKECVLDVTELATSSQIVPGSSGGPLVNASGDLIGVASATDNALNWFVPLSDVQTFTGNY